MRSSFICMVFYSFGIIGPTCAGGIEILPRQDTGVSQPPYSAPTRTSPATDPSSKPSDILTGTVSASHAHMTSKSDPTGTTGVRTDMTTTQGPSPTDLSFLDVDQKQDPNKLPLPPRINPGLSVVGIVLIIAGGIYALIGVKTKWIQIFLSTGFLSAVAVTILIIYLIQPPVSNATQGGFVVAAVATGAIFGGVSLAFQEVTERLGSMLGGFSLSMWILSMKSGGLLVETGHKAAFITSLTLALYCLSFHHLTRPYWLLASTSFSGATAIVLGIDCFSRAGLKEFWVYIWGLNEKMFPSKTNTYPITRGIRVEIAAIVVVFLMGLISQFKLWKVIRDRTQKTTALKEEEQKERDQTEEEIARNLEEGTRRERARWETIYGDRPGKPNDSGIVMVRSDTQRSGSGAQSDSTPLGQSRTAEMESLRKPDGDGTRESTLPIFTTAGMPIEHHDPASIGSAIEDINDPNSNRGSSEQEAMQEPLNSAQSHHPPANTEVHVSGGIPVYPFRANHFEDVLDDGSSSVAASLAESNYMAGIDSSTISIHSTQQATHDQHGGCNPIYDHSNKLEFLIETRSITSSIEVEPNEELVYDPETASKVENPFRNSLSTMNSDIEGTAEPAPIAEPDSTTLENASGGESPKRSEPPPPTVTVGVADVGRSEPMPSLLPDIVINSDKPGNFNQGGGDENSSAADAPARSSKEANEQMLDQQAGAAGAAESVSNRSSVTSNHPVDALVSDQQTPDKQDSANGIQESLSSRIHGSSMRLSKRQSAFSARALLTSESVDNIPSHVSKVILSYRTNEWAKHISDAEAPENKDVDYLQQDAEIKEPVVPVIISELQQTASGNLSRSESETKYPDPRKSQIGRGSVSKPLVKSGINVQKANIPSLSPPGSSNCTIRSQTPSVHQLDRSASSSSLSIPRQVDVSRSRPASFSLSPYRTPGRIPEIEEIDEKSFPVRRVRVSSPPLLVQRETAIRNRSLLLPSNYSSTSVNRVSRPQGQLSLALPQRFSSNLSSHYQTSHSTPIESADDLPLSVVREQMHKGMQSQSQVQTQKFQQHRLSSCVSSHSLDNVPITATLRNSQHYQSHAPDPLLVREAKLARWRESLKEEIAKEHVPEAAVETQRANLMKERRRDQLGRQQAARRASYRDSVLEMAMRNGNLQEMHKEALRRMQATANSRV
ncbi:hypothetical protein PAAG_07297 [Paracoccidioides lutzii Pb01]|uniref:TM7S3/TM198-like domain-containing protein n=1 Tax=Paracoccidioides lutzii (strain ATCC MYA-826 / Pb01) TaxID=502779 RepID=C1H956_PARBA|nr:hypothetical protein PAAG_07297 [Paracoccidioides lutzii Pb01]EEH36879.2 hypothetical protein PAAG_07297 [Paracoccidioides lutzii Pb01]